MSETPVSNSKAVALIGLFSALYIVSAGIVGTITGPGLAAIFLSGGYPEHILRGIFMAAVVISTRRMWSATLMGIVCGLIFVFTVPAPADALYLFPSTAMAGLVYDLTLLSEGPTYSLASTSKRKVLIGAATSGVTESVVALGLLTYVVHYSFALVVWLYWLVDIPLNVALSLLGASIAVGYMLRKRATAERLQSTPVSQSRPVP